MKQSNRQNDEVVIFDNQDKKQGAVIRKPGSQKLYVLFYYFSHRVEKSTGENDSPANRIKIREWLDRVITLRDCGKLVFAEAFPGATEQEKILFAKYEGREYAPAPEDVLFGNYVQTWKTNIMENLDSQNKRDEYERDIEYWLLPYFKDIPMAKITGTMIKQYVLKDLVWKHSKHIGKRLSRSRIRNIMIPFREIWNDACCDYNWNLPNPFISVNRKNLPKARRVKPVVYRFSEWQKLLESLNSHYKNIAEFFVLTGLSGSEISGLKKSAVMKDHFVIQESIVRCISMDTLKTDFRFREIPLTARLRDIISEAAAVSQSEYVFSMKNGKNFSTDNFRKIWITACKKSGVFYRKPYTTRHTFVAWSLCIHQDLNKLVDLMGHASKRMIYDVYGKYVKGLEEDRLLILKYFGSDYLVGSNGMILDSQTSGESYSESQGSRHSNHPF